MYQRVYREPLGAGLLAPFLGSLAVAVVEFSTQLDFKKISIIVYICPLHIPMSRDVRQGQLVGQTLPGTGALVSFLEDNVC